MTVSKSRARWLTALGLAIGLASSAMGGCAVDDQDLRRWETTLGGPERLTAVVLHDKYPQRVRVHAAMSLIRMKPRKGQHVGITRLVEKTLVELSPEPRARLLADLIPLMIEELRRPPPPATQAGQQVADPSFKLKDAAYLMLTYDKTQIITDQALRKQLMQALTEWAMDDFERKLNERSQAYGMEQLLRHIGPPSVVKLPAQMHKGSRNLAKMADLVAKIGSQETRAEASTQLVKVVEYVASEEWRKKKLPELREANRKSGFDPTDKQLDKQLRKFQNESVVRVYASMKKVGGAAVVDYCLKVAADKDQPEARRQTALAALEGHIDRKSTKQIDALLAIAKTDAPPVVVDQAFRRIRELPRSLVAKKLYAFFEVESWKIRRLAAATLLQMSTVKHVNEFLDNVGLKATKNFNLPEAITYGAYLAALKEGNPLDKLRPRMLRGRVQARLSAISYYYDRGNKLQLDALTPLLGDKQAVPECNEDAECDWTCVIGEGKSQETKEIKTVGDFVTYCIKPKMEETAPGKKKPGKDDKGMGKGKGADKQKPK